MNFLQQFVADIKGLVLFLLYLTCAFKTLFLFVLVLNEFRNNRKLDLQPLSLNRRTGILRILKTCKHFQIGKCRKKKKGTSIREIEFDIIVFHIYIVTAWKKY